MRGIQGKCHKLTEDVCSIIPAVHALLGCNTNSSLHWIGKWTVYNAITKTAKDLQGLFHYEDRDEFLVSARRFVLLLDGKKAKCQASLDDLRYHLATTTDKPLNQLPPTEDAFDQHVSQAQCQVQIWNQSHIPKPEMANPVDNGWRISESRELHPVYYTKESAPAEVRDITHLYCSDKMCTGQKCPCVVAGLSCIDICSCAGECQNRNKPAESEGEVSTDL